MANPNVNAPTRLEEVPQGGGPGSMLQHDDMHLGNSMYSAANNPHIYWIFSLIQNVVMIGGNPPFREHRLMPVVKLIDFGIAASRNGRPAQYRSGLGPHKNVNDAAMVRVIPRYLDQFSSHKDPYRHPGFIKLTLSFLASSSQLFLIASVHDFGSQKMLT